MPLTCGNTVPEVGLEPTHLSILHFECSASTIPPLGPSQSFTFVTVTKITLLFVNRFGTSARNYSTCI